MSTKIQIPQDDTLSFTSADGATLLEASLLDLQLLLDECQWGLGDGPNRVRAWIPGYTAGLSKLAGNPVSEAQAYRIAEVVAERSHALKKSLAPQPS